jgi:predicted acyl esterase
LDHGSNADGDIHAEQAEWFRYWLDPERKPKTKVEPEVRCYERGSGEWRSYGRESPLSSQGQPIRLWLDSLNKPANGALGGGVLTQQRVNGSHSPPDVFVYDARMPMMLEGFQPKDRRIEQDRYENLVYTSEPVTGNTRLYGSITLKAQVQTIGGPTDLVAVVSVVGLNGEAAFLTAGVAETSAESDEKGLWQTLQLKLRPVAIELQAGEAVRIELTGSAYPLYARHPNGRSMSQEHLAGPDQLHMASVSIHYEGSMLELPVKVKEVDVSCTGLEMAEMTGM